MLAAGIVALALAAVAACAAIYQLLAQHGRLLLRMESVERSLREGQPAERFAAYWRQHYSKASLAETFDDVYARGLWGNERGRRLYSGDAARGETFEQYCRLVVPEITRRGIGSLVDIGCGDFHVGTVLAGSVASYTGVDVSKLAVSTNQELHGSPERRFVRADATTDPLPAGDAAVVRQVLQHLSNAEIECLLKNVLSTYRTVFITEDLHRESESRPNLDMHHGPHTRITERSGVRIDLPPFHIPAKLVGDIAYSPDGFLRTWVVER